MQRAATRWTLALLAVSVLAVVPTLAENPGAPATDLATPDAPSLEAQLEEPPAQTPVQSEDIVQVTDPDHGLILEGLAQCSREQGEICPDGCLCLVVRGQVQCFCDLATEVQAPALQGIEQPAEPNQELFFEAISACDERRHCPSPSCACLVIRNEVNCFC